MIVGNINIFCEFCYELFNLCVIDIILGWLFGIML